MKGQRHPDALIDGCSHPQSRRFKISPPDDSNNEEGSGDGAVAAVVSPTQLWNNPNRVAGAITTVAVDLSPQNLCGVDWGLERAQFSHPILATGPHRLLVHKEGTNSQNPRITSQ